MSVQYTRAVQYNGGYHEYSRGDIMSTAGVFSTLGDTMMSVGNIMSRPGDVQYIGDSIQIQFFSQ